MKYKTIQAIHEARMIVTGLFVGGMALAAYLDAHPEAKLKLKHKVDKIRGVFDKNYQPEEVIVFTVVKDKEEQG
jgi:hypothetical protein